MFLKTCIVFFEGNERILNAFDSKIFQITKKVYNNIMKPLNE